MPPTFADLGVPEDLALSLTRRGMTSPFPVQTLTLPDSLKGRDVSGMAPTGSGKTLAFGIAVIARMGNAKAAPKRPLALILTPTRELAGQVAEELTALGAPRGRKVISVYGGVGYGPQIKALSRGADVVVACPGRLTDLVEQGNVILDRVGIVVIDEADRMADMGFLPAVRHLLDQTPQNRQTLLFSATLDGDVDVLVRKYQTNPVRHLHDPEPGMESKAKHLFWKVDGADRVAIAAGIATASGPTIVFCRTRHGTDRTARQLGAHGIRAVTIHGDRSQAQRERALASFAEGSASALVATDVAARGIHVDGVAAVVHFDPPADSKDYVHRSGRTARAGAEGLVVSLVTPQVSSAVRTLQRQLGMPLQVDLPDMAGIASNAPAVPFAGPGSKPASTSHTEPQHRDNNRSRKPSRSFGNDSDRYGDSNRPKPGSAKTKPAAGARKGRAIQTHTHGDSRPTSGDNGPSSPSQPRRPGNSPAFGQQGGRRPNRRAGRSGPAR